MTWMSLPLKRMADFRGRSRRREFWMFTLFEVAVICATGFIDRALGDTSGKGIIGPGRPRVHGPERDGVDPAIA